MRAQLSESVSFVIFVVAIIFFIIISRIFILGGAVQSLSTTADRNENERLKSGVNALFLMKDERSKLPLLDLLGRGVAERTDMVLLSKYESPINISSELEWRMNAMFGQNNWHLTVPFTEKKEFITQIVIVADMSSSLCDDLKDMKKLPPIIEEMNKKGKKVSATLYMLGRSDCKIVDYPEITCNDFETEHFACRSLSLGNWIDAKGIRCIFFGLPRTKWDTKEDWGNGMACAAQNGPVGGWSKEYSVRLGVIITDELSGGSECGCTKYGECTINGKLYSGCCLENDGCVTCDVGSNSNQFQSVENGLKAASLNNMSVFGLLANACGNLSSQGTAYEYICNCQNVLKNHLNYIALNSSGKVFALRNSSQVSDTITEIILKSEPRQMNIIDIGVSIPRSVRIRSYDVLVPLPEGNYTRVIAYTW